MRAIRPSQIREASINVYVKRGLADSAAGRVVGRGSFAKYAATEDKILCDNQWLQLKDRDGYVFSHEVRCNGAIVLVLPYRQIDNGRGRDVYEYLVRDEVTPCWNPDGPTRSAITGGVENGEPLEDAVRELQEEAGFTVEPTKFQFLGKCRASKSADTFYFLYAVDLAGLEPGEALGDGSKNDQAPSVWISGEELCQLEDAQAITAYAKLGLR